MKPFEIAVVRTGCSNLASVVSGLRRLGCAPIITEDAGVVGSMRLAVLPGVGAFGPAMLGLRERGLDEALRKRFERGLPLLAICLGMQLLCAASDESPGVSGLGIVPGVVRRFRGAVRVPQMGWNRICPSPGAALLGPAVVYFANSYRLDCLPEGWEGATSEHAGEFACAIERGTLLACQFHPELSGEAGQKLIGRWLMRSRECGPC